MTENEYKAVKEFLEEADGEDIASIIREINGYNGDMDGYEWYDMCELDDMTCGMGHWEVLRLAHYGNFNPTHDYFRFDGYGNLESTDYPEYDSTDIEEIIEAIDRIPYQYLPDDIKGVLSEVVEDEEEEEE